MWCWCDVVVDELVGHLFQYVRDPSCSLWVYHMSFKYLYTLSKVCACVTVHACSVYLCLLDYNGIKVGYLVKFGIFETKYLLFYVLKELM